MKTADIIRRAGRSLKQAKARTLLTSLAIGVGAFTITLSLAAGAGGRSYTDQIVKANSDVKELVVTKKVVNSDAPTKYTGATSATGSGPTGGSSGGSVVGITAGSFLNQSDIDKIEKLAHVASVSPSYSPAVKYITRDGQDKYLAPLSTFSPGVSLTYAAGGVSGDLSDDGIVLTEAYAKALGFSSSQQAIGQTVDIVADKLSSPLSNPQSQTFTFVVKGVSSKSGLAFRAQSTLLVSNATAKTLYDYINKDTRSYGNYTVASVHVDNADQATNVKNTLDGMGYNAQTSADILGTVNTFINVLQGILLGFGALAVLTSVFGIINTQYISVLERTQQIGLMKALGMRRRDIGRLLKFEAAWIGFFGGAIGSGLAVIVGLAANPFISSALNLGDIRLLIFSPVSVVLVVIALILVSVGAGILPARKAAKLDPIEALRTE
jgi:putative ABC transport system permease protein